MSYPLQASTLTTKHPMLETGEIDMAGEYDGRFEAIVAEVIKDEGGYVDHPNDKGGPTKYGITMRFYEEAFGYKPTRDTIKNLTVNDARRAYHKVIWQKNGVHMLPSELQPVMFDWITMSGPRTPIKFLQRRVGAKPDGVMGPKTAKATRTKIQEKTYRVFHTEFVNGIVRFLIRITKRDPSQTVFLEGWFNRFCEYYLDEGATNEYADNACANHNEANIQPTSGRGKRSVRDAGRHDGQGDRTSTVALEKSEGARPRRSRGKRT